MVNWQSFPKFTRVLLIEDDIILSQFIKRKLDKIGIQIRVVGNGAVGLNEAMKNAYSLLLVDIGLPEVSGLTIIDKLRKKGISTPAIIITDGKLPGSEKASFAKGANLYHPKPLDFDLLNIQVSNLLRLHSPKPIIEIGDLYLEPNKRYIRKADKELELSFKEYELILLLISAEGNILSRQEIINRTLRGVTDSDEGSVDTLVSRMRRKLGKYANKHVIETVNGLGFRLNLSYFKL